MTFLLRKHTLSGPNKQGTSKLKSDNHYYRQCKNRVIEDARSNDRLLRSRPILLSDIILPTLRQGVGRSELIKCDILDPTDQMRGLDVYRLQRVDLELLREREAEIFPCDI